MNSKTERVNFELPEDHWSGASVESVWVDVVGPERYQINNILSLVPQVSFRDVVAAKLEGDALWFVRVVEKSGHSTVRLRWRHSLFPSFRRNSLLKQIDMLGLGIEGGYFGGWRLLALDVPPHFAKPVLTSIIKEGESSKAWEAVLADDGGFESEWTGLWPV